MEYKINVEITLDDYKSYNNDFLFARKKNLKILIFVLAVLLFALAFIDIILFKEKKSFIYFIPLIAFILFFIFYYFIFYPKRIEKVYKLDSHYYKTHEVTLREDKITLITSRSSSNYFLDDIRSVLFGKKVIQIYVSTNSAVLIPRHCISEKEKEIEDFIKTYYVKSK